MEASSLEDGALLESEYLLEDKLGEGTGHVQRARRKRDGRLMVVRTFQIDSQPLAAEFLEFAQLASRVRHPVLANVEAFGRQPDGRCFLVSEYVVGQRLDDWADEVGIPPLGQVIEMVRRICLGLQAAARSGLAHDGLNPRNVIIIQPAQGTGPRLPIKLLDLGVPAFLRPSQPRPQALRFMSPEQLAALSSPDAAQIFRCTTAMNVYSCGCLLYFLCTGGPPYPGNTIEELRTAQTTGRLAPPQRINPQISPALNALILRALALEPAERFASVGELAEALASAVGTLQPFVRQSVVPDTQSSPSLRTSQLEPVAGPPEDDGPPTFKTTRPAELSGVMRNPAAHEHPTLPPAAGELEIPAGIAGAPIGLFSSAPPFSERRSPPPPPLTATGERAPPVALFSEPPPAALTPLSAPTSIVVAEPEPVQSQLVAPYNVRAATRARRRQRLAPGWVWPLAGVACLAAYFGVRHALAPANQPSAALAPAARGGEPIVPEAARPAPQPPAAISGAERQPEPAPQLATGAVPPAEPVEPKRAVLQQAAPQLASGERPRERSRGHRARESRGSERAGGVDASKEAAAPPSESAPSEPEHSVEPEVAHARVDTAELAPEKSRKEELQPLKATPSVVKVERPQPALPLQAKVQIQAVEVRGSLPTSLVRRAVERIRSQLSACYARAAQSAGHNGFGEVTVTVQIDERGRAKSPVARGGSLPQLDACVSDAASKLVSEKAPDTGTVSASWKVTFTP
jgi:eukaryotic-like serine/threonine-protein kinase